MDLLSHRLVDLTHSLHSGIPAWDLCCGFQQQQTGDYQEHGFRVQSLTMPAGIGTHIDAPAHVCQGGRTVSQWSLAELLTPCVVIDVSARATADYSVTVGDIQAFEHSHGKIAANSVVLIYTGWERYWSEPARYHNHHCFPSVGQAAAQYLLERQIAGLGIDTLSPDRPSDGFPVHELVLGQDKFLLENVAHAKQLPPLGASLLTVPLVIEGGTEAPARLIGILP